jgi:hypothetical protein
LSFVLASHAFEVRVDSETIIRHFERDDRDGDESHVRPAYEYLRIEFGELEEKGFSFHGYGWGRFDLGNSSYFSDDSGGEVLYAYLQYSQDSNNVLVRVGRQFIYEGVSNQSVDGVSVKSNVTPLFTVSSYFGLAVGVEEVDGRSGDHLFGGRLAHHLGSRYEVGISYKYLANDSDKQVKVLGIDSSVNLSSFNVPIPVSFHGLSSRNLVDNEWQEHSYEASIPVYNFLLRPFFERFDYDAYFDAGEATGSPFVFLAGSDETVTTYGSDLIWYLTGKLETGLKAKHYDYDKRDDNAWYYAGQVTLRGKGLSQVGGEVGVMDGGSSDTQYTLWRGQFYWDVAPSYVSGDIMYVAYDEDVGADPLDQDRSFFTSLGVGHWFLEDTLEARFSADYSSDPYFDDDLRGMVTLRYILER